MLKFLRRVLTAGCLLLLMPTWGFCKLDYRSPFYDEADVLSPAFTKTYKDSYLAGRSADAYTQWLKQAWQGDMHAMATLAALSRTQTPRFWPVPPEFWEQWIVELLGEGEGNYVLGQQYALISDTLAKGHLTAKKAEEFFLRSALTGHLPGMFSAGFTAEGRDGTPFTPPALPRVDPIPLRFNSEDTRGETRYWWARAADAGYWKAAAMVGVSYAEPDNGPPDYDKAEHYMTIAAQNGLGGGHWMWGILTRRTNSTASPCAKVFTPISFWEPDYNRTES